MYFNFVALYYFYYGFQCPVNMALLFPKHSPLSVQMFSVILKQKDTSGTEMRQR